MRIGYVGPEGSYSHEAAWWCSPQAQLVPENILVNVVQLVGAGILDRGVVPIENSTEGVVTAVVDALYQAVHVVMLAEFVLPIAHNLLSVNGESQCITRIFSHTQALEQCRSYLNKQYPYATLLPCESTSRACELAKAEGKGAAAIASALAGKLYNLQVVADKIQDNPRNKTRFVMIGPQNHHISLQASSAFSELPHYNRGDAQKATDEQLLFFPQCERTGIIKTSIACTFSQDSPGSLYAVLKEFARKGINLSRIESRPAKEELGMYVFYIDFEAALEDADVQMVLKRVKKLTQSLHIFGSYPCYRIPVMGAINDIGQWS